MMDSLDRAAYRMILTVRCTHSNPESWLKSVLVWVEFVDQVDFQRSALLGCFKIYVTGSTN
jgi:hypothetical protein